MQEAKRFLGEIRDTVNRKLSELSDVETSETLMLPGRVEQLVQEGRPPLRLGSVGTGDGPMEPWYQVPPKGFDPKKIKEVFMGAGCYVFVYKNGKQKIGSTFTLTDEQAEQVEQRITSERERLGLTNDVEANDEVVDDSEERNIQYYIALLRQTALMQAVLPGERQKRVARDFSTRFSKVREQLADMGCEVDFSGIRERMSANAPWVTTVHLTAPKDREVEIMDLLAQAGIDLPDQTMWQASQREALGLAVEKGWVKADDLDRETRKTRIVVYDGKGWQDEDTERVKIERPSVQSGTVFESESTG